MKLEGLGSILRSSRRRFLRLGTAAGAVFTACDSESEAPEEAPSKLGAPLSRYGKRSPHERAARLVRESKTPEEGGTRTPLEDSYGILTPSSLHFERHHSGVPAIDPAEHRLLIHGMVERPLILTMEEIRRLPSITRILFVECSGNSRTEWFDAGAPTVRHSHGMASCSEWTGVPLSVLLEEVGPRPEASWILAEGADACHMQRSLPIGKALDDCLLAYAQNGEAIRPEQGYPLRLLVPGFEGNISVKWLRRLKFAPGPYMTRDETSKYTDLMPDGTARQFTFVMDLKSVITRPSGGQKLPGAGKYEISGLAWSGRGSIESVEVSTDGGASWQEARLDEPRLPLAFTRFRLAWEWDGSDAVLKSRCRDDTGRLQPTRGELIAERGLNSDYHNNSIKAWRVASDGSVTNVEA